MKVNILVDCKGSNDGVIVREYVQGQEYTVSPELGRLFLEAGYAEPVKEVVETDATEPEPGEIDPPADGEGKDTLGDESGKEAAKSEPDAAAKTTRRR